MSSQHFEKITCPKCQKDSEFVMYDSVNVSLDPEDKEKIIDGSLFLFKCPECGAEVHVEYGVLYHDMDKQLMIQTCSDPESAANAPAINEPMKKFANLMADYKFRTVVGSRRLSEKVRIFDAELDDFAVEIFKAWIWRSIDGEKELFFDNIEDGKLEFVVCFDDGRCHGFHVPYEDYEKCKKLADSLPNKEQLQYVDAMWFLPMFEEDK
jgi:hypothetical protein